MAVKQQDPRFFTTSAGIEIELSPVPPLQAEMARGAAQKEAESLYGVAVKPTYRTEMDEELPHDEKTIEDERTTPEDKAAWAKYQEVQAQIEQHVSNATMRFFLFYGVKADPDADKSWEAVQRHFKIEIPDDPIDRKIHYVQTQLIASQNDLGEIVARIMSIGGVRQDLIDAAVASFRS